jgi:hypothetical protein
MFSDVATFLLLAHQFLRCHHVFCCVFFADINFVESDNKNKKRLLLDLNSSRQQLVSLENSVSSLKNQLEEFHAENTRLIKDLVIFF